MLCYIVVSTIELVGKTVFFCHLIERYYKPVQSNIAATRHTATEYVKYSQCMPHVEMLIAWTYWIK